MNRKTSGKLILEAPPCVLDSLVSLNVMSRNCDSFAALPPKTLVNGVNGLAGHRKTKRAEFLREQKPALTSNAMECDMADNPLYEVDTPCLAKDPDFDPALLHKFVRFDADSGKYYWLPRDASTFKNNWAASNFSKIYAGKEVANGQAINRYRRLCIHGRRIAFHRFVWAFHHGVWPDGDIDHINGNPGDNRLENLRVVSQSLNMRNRKIDKRNKSGYTGVWLYKDGKRWRATIKVADNAIHLGIFPTKMEAVAARKAAESRLGFHPNHGRAR